MSGLIDLPVPDLRGTYFILVEPDVVRVGSGNLSVRWMRRLRTSTHRRIALLAWSNYPQKSPQLSFGEDWITGEFFWLSANLLTHINKCRVSAGFPSVEEFELWEFGVPISPQAQVVLSAEEQAKRGRFHTHVRWHTHKPNSACEFCVASEPVGPLKSL